MPGTSESGLGGKHVLPQSFVGGWWEAVRDAELRESEIQIVEFESKFESLSVVAEHDEH